MKNIFIKFITGSLLLPAVFLLPGTDTAAQNSGIKEKTALQQEEDSVASGWSMYSFGQFYKNLFLESNNKKDAGKYLDLAIDYFQKALGKNESSDRVQFQISDCYYLYGKNELALDHARKSITADPANPHPYYLIFRIRLAQKENDKAAQILEEYCSVKPHSVFMKFELGKHYYNRMRAFDKAEKQFTDIVRISSSLPVHNFYRVNSYIFLGYINYSANKLKRALRYFKKADELEGGDPETMFFVAYLSMLLDDIETAEVYAARYLKENGANPVINSLLGKIYYLKEDPRAVYHLGMVKDAQTVDGLTASALYNERFGRDEAALGYIEAVLQFQPKEIPLHVALARIFQRKNKLNDAFKQYYAAGVLLYEQGLYPLATVYLDRANALEKNVPDVHYYLARSHEGAGDIYEAIGHYRRANELKANSGLALHIGYLYGVKRDYGAAMNWFNAVAADEPKNAQVHLFKGIISIWRERYDDAELFLKKALSLDDKDESFYFYLAVTMEKKRRIDKAIDYLKLAIKNDGKSARSLNYLGYLYADNDMKLDQSLMLIEKALKIEPHNGAYVDSLGWVHFKKGDFKAALAKLLLAEKLLTREKTPDPVVFDHIGDTYHRMGMFRKAIRYWNKSVELEGNEAIERKILRLQQQMKKEKNS